MNLHKRIKNIEEKLDQKMDQRVVICFDREGERVNKDGTKFEIPSGFDEERDLIITIDWALKQ